MNVILRGHCLNYVQNLETQPHTYPRGDLTLLWPCPPHQIWVPRLPILLPRPLLCTTHPLPTLEVLMARQRRSPTMKDQEKTEKSNQNPENEDFQANVKCERQRLKLWWNQMYVYCIFIVKIGEN